MISNERRQPRFAEGEPAGGADDGGTLALWDWRRQVSSLYAAVRAEPDPQTAWTNWRAGRDRLFAGHPQSPLEPATRRDFAALRFFPYDPALRFVVDVVPIDEQIIPFPAGNDGEVRMRPFGRTDGLAASLGGELTLFWILGYGGGVFLPFTDATSGDTTYGAGRYLLDTIKSADLGNASDDRFILDFNFAYNPSCCYSDRYVCPLAPRVNRLPRPVQAGEMTWARNRSGSSPTPEARSLSGPDDGERPFRVIDPCWIDLPDGTRLAATVWLPEDAEQQPVPAILEYLPYRRGDGTVLRDRTVHAFWAAHGYAGVRVDIRGTGDSDGVLGDEYLPQEQADAVAVIAWLARQPWCSGAVGMMGISWGGFNALQVASHAPPALKAIITVCSTDDRYADDCHYMGGCLLNNSFAFGSTMLAAAALPPDPLVVGERWRDLWRERLDNHPLMMGEWLAHQTRDAYWRQGSVCEDYTAIKAAVYAVGGWADAYTNSIGRLLGGLPGPRKGLIGPWAHAYPHSASPGPAIGFLHEGLRWWDHWLKGRPTGIMDEPLLRVWMQDSVRPAATYGERPGRWVAEPVWPPVDRPPLRIALSAMAPSADTVLVASPVATGTTFGQWCPYGLDGELPVDQRPDDGRSAVFDTAPLYEALEILGTPRVTLAMACDRPNGQVAVRLEDVAEDGASTLVTYGLLNLTHRDGHENPQPLVPGETVTISIALNDVGYGFPTGHRLRLAIASGHWPTAWPSPEPVRLTLWPEHSELTLPQRRPQAGDDDLAPFGPPEDAAPPPHELLQPGERSQVIVTDPATGTTRVEMRRQRAAVSLLDTGLVFAGGSQEQYTVRDGHPDATRFESRGLWRLERGSWRVRTETTASVTATREAFRIVAQLEAFEGDERVAFRTWDRVIHRNGA